MGFFLRAIQTFPDMYIHKIIKLAARQMGYRTQHVKTNGKQLLNRTNKLCGSTPNGILNTMVIECKHVM